MAVVEAELMISFWRKLSKTTTPLGFFLCLQKISDGQMSLSTLSSHWQVQSGAPSAITFPKWSPQIWPLAGNYNQSPRRTRHAELPPILSFFPRNSGKALIELKPITLDGLGPPCSICSICSRQNDPIARICVRHASPVGGASPVASPRHLQILV